MSEPFVLTLWLYSLRKQLKISFDINNSFTIRLYSLKLTILLQYVVH